MNALNLMCALVLRCLCVCVYVLFYLLVCPSVQFSVCLHKQKHQKSFPNTMPAKLLISTNSLKKVVTARYLGLLVKN